MKFIVPDHDEILPFDQHFTELPEKKQGQLDLKLEWKPPRPGLQLAFDVISRLEVVLIKYFTFFLVHDVEANGRPQFRAGHVGHAEQCQCTEHISK